MGDYSYIYDDHNDHKHPNFFTIKRGRPEQYGSKHFFHLQGNQSKEPNTNGHHFFIVLEIDNHHPA